MRYTRNNRRESRNAYFGEVNGIVPTGNFLYPDQRRRDRRSRLHDELEHRSSTFARDGSASRSRTCGSTRGWSIPASLGFTPAVDGALRRGQYFPLVDVGSFSGIGDNLAGDDDAQHLLVPADLHPLAGSHAIKAGYDWRMYKEFSVNPGRAGGEYQFRGTYTRARTTRPISSVRPSPASCSGSRPAGRSIATPTGLNYTMFNGMFVQDDWKISSRLTINLGLRYELRGRDDASRRTGTCAASIRTPTSASPAAAKAAYAANPIRGAAGVSVQPARRAAVRLGRSPGLLERGQEQHSAARRVRVPAQPKTVVRGGAGIYAVPYIISGVVQHGFSQSTPFVASDDLGLTFAATSPIRTRPACCSRRARPREQTRSSVRASAASRPLDLRNGQNARYLVSVQRELPGQWLFEVGYTGSRGYDLTTDLDLEPDSRCSTSSTSRVRDQADDRFSGGAGHDPFAGSRSRNGLQRRDRSRGQLLKPYPQFTGVTSNASDGSTSYNSAQMKLERRFTKGYCCWSATRIPASSSAFPS